MSTIKELSAKGLRELREIYRGFAREEMNLRFQKARKELKDTSVLKKLRVRKARVKMLLVRAGKEV